MAEKPLLKTFELPDTFGGRYALLAIDSIFPGQLPEDAKGDAVRDIVRAQNPENVTADDLDNVIGLDLRYFVASNCHQVDSVRAGQLWAKLFAFASEDWPRLRDKLRAGHPTLVFPDDLSEADFAQPAIDCDTNVLKLITFYNAGCRKSFEQKGA